MKKKIISVFLLISLVLALFSCSGEEPGNGNQIGETTVVLSESSLTFTEVGENHTFDYYVIEDGRIAPERKSEVVFTSTDTEVAVCNGSTITSTGYGFCMIRATYKNKFAVCTVQTPNPNSLLSISRDNVVLDNIGSKINISAFSETGNEITSSIEWYSSNDSIAVCDNGVILATGYGYCTITARSQTQSAVCTVTVNDPTTPTVIMSESTLSLKVGEAHTVTASVSHNAGKIVSWISSDEAIATCKDGKITAHKEGVAVILAVTQSGKSGFTVVKVGNPKRDFAFSEHLNFDFRDFCKELKYINRNTSEVDSSVVIYDYKIETQLLIDGRLVVEITLFGVKTYDASGTDGDIPSAITASLYRENDAFCDKKQYYTTALKIGEKFKIKHSGFTVQTNEDGTARELYMTFSAITEHRQTYR